MVSGPMFAIMHICYKYSKQWYAQIREMRYKKVRGQKGLQTSPSVTPYFLRGLQLLVKENNCQVIALDKTV
jgi:hypothetical protein